MTEIETHALARRVHEALLAWGETVAVAESLTGGALAAALVSVPGVSATFRGGVVAYATDLKGVLLGVDTDLLARIGPVDALVAVQMADGVQRRLGATYGLAATGVAGPDSQDGHPTGEVHLGLACGGRREPLHRRLDLAGDRARVRADAVQAALRLMLEALDDVAARRAAASGAAGDPGNAEL